MTSIETITTTNSPELFQARRNHLDCSAITTLDQWAEVGQALRGIEDGARWWAGDWLNHGEAMFGEECSQYLEAADRTLIKYRWICEAYTIEDRVEGLSFTHHEIVANVENRDDRNEMLHLALEHNMSTRGLRDHLRRYTLGQSFDDTEPDPQAPDLLSDAEEKTARLVAQHEQHTPADAIRFMLTTTLPSMFGDTPADVVDACDNETDLQELHKQAAQMVLYSKQLLSQVLNRINNS